MTVRGLSNSRWAASSSYRTHSLPPSNRLDVPRTTTSGNPPPRSAGSPSTTTTSTGSAPPQPALPNYITAAALPPAAELARYTKIVRRLKWKLPFLAAGYQQAVALASASANHSSSPPDQHRGGEAELMFKLDFFEYYMLCERALVHLLSVYGLAPERGTSPVHRYHAAVLEALDDEANPLHGALGRGEVRRQLARAKDLRNRWKNADADATTPPEGQGRQEGIMVVNNNGVNGGAQQQQPYFMTALQRERDRREAARPSLESYDLENILQTIFAGFDAAYVIAEGYVAELKSRDKAEGAVAGAGQEEGEVPMNDGPEEQWDFMVDAMDWEAV